MAQNPANIKAPPNTVLFTPHAIIPTSTAVPEDPTVQEDINKESGWFYLSAWDQRGQLIRSGRGPNATEYCLGNLSLALRELGALNAAEYSGASAALSLLPTAGALIGSPAKELWVVYKLMPLSGVLSMFLSLGGTLVPENAGAYDPQASFTYGGLMATDSSSPIQRDHTSSEPKEHTGNKNGAEAFAEKVRQRSEEEGGSNYNRVWFGVGIQCILVVVILIALWYGQMGGVITWWCNVSILLTTRSYRSHSNRYGDGYTSGIFLWL